MANDLNTEWVQALMTGALPPKIEDELTPEELALQESWFAPLLPPPPKPAQGMAESLIARSTAPEPIPPMGMADSLAQRSGDDLVIPATPISDATPAPRATMPTNLPTALDKALPSTSNEFADAQAARNNLLAWQMIGRGGERIGTAISGTQSNPNYLSELTAFAENKVKDLETKRKLRGSDQEQLIRDYELKIMGSSNDPNSRISQATRAVVKKYDPSFKVDGMSHAELKQILGPLANQAEAELARQARKELAELTAKDKQEKADEKDKDQKRTFTRDLRKELTSGQYGKLYGNVNSAQKAAGAIGEFLKDPTGYSDYATLMGGLKALQGDESVVREAEIKLGMEAGSFKEKISNNIEKLRSGKSLQHAQRQNILKSVQILRDITRQQYLEGIAPILEQATAEGIEPSLLIPGNVRDTGVAATGSKEKERKTKDGRIAIFDTSTNPPKFVRYKDGNP